MKRFCNFLIIAYVAACLLALAVIPLSNAGMFGLQPDPLSAVFAIILALPWTFVTSQLVQTSDPAWSFLFIGAGMGLNAGVLRLLCKWFNEKSGEAP